MFSASKRQLDNIKVINPKTYKNFPYQVSTKLYPEWPFSKLNHTSNRLANQVVSQLLNIPYDSIVAKETNVGGWTVPLDYAPVHILLKKLHILFDFFKFYF